MTGLKVVLFISFLIFAITGLIGLISPATLTAMGFTQENADPAYTRIAATAILAFALAAWYTFRDPVKNVVVVRVIITWLGLEGIFILVGGITGAIAWAGALPGVIFDGVLAILLGVFYPRSKKAT